MKLGPVTLLESVIGSIKLGPATLLESVLVDLGYGFRELLFLSSTVMQEKPTLVKNAIDLYVYVIGKDIEITDASTDGDGFLMINHASFSEIGENVKVYIETSDEAMSVAGIVTIQDVGEYL